MPPSHQHCLCGSAPRSTGTDAPEYFTLKEHTPLTNTTLFWVWLAEALGADNGNGVRLLHALQTPMAIYSASRDTLKSLAFLSPKELDNLCDKSLAAAQWILDTAANEHIGIMTYDMQLYPERLRRIQNPPLVLYYRGNFKGLADKLAIAVVGTRKMSPAGRKTTYRLAFELASVGAVIVSGMARGVDGTAHRAALDAGGYTIAVLGTAINVCYPPEHKELYQTLIRHGCVISEYAPQTKTQSWFFPQRNRIMSGLSQGTLVTEGDMRSGALITADKAIAQGRDIFALPGDPDDPLREGTNDLLKRGAHPVTQTTDILLHYDKLYTTLHTERLSDRNIYLNYDELGERHSYKTVTTFVEAPAEEELREERYEIPKDVLPSTHMPASKGENARVTKKITPSDRDTAALTLGDILDPQTPQMGTAHSNAKKVGKRPTPRMPSIKDLFSLSKKPLVTKEPSPEELYEETSTKEPLSEPIAEQRKPARAKKRTAESIPLAEEAEYVPPSGISEEEARLLTALSEKKTVDELCALGIPMSDILTSLTMLEIDGHVSALPGGYFIRNNKKS